MHQQFNRRRFLEMTAALALLGAGCSRSSLDERAGTAPVTQRSTAFDPIAVPEQSDPASLIVVITIDDLNDYVGFLDGYSGAVTPNLDALAAESLVYESAYCSSPACASSRPSLLFGEEPTVSGMYSNAQWQWWRSSIAGTRESLPFRLKNAGYRTHGYGKVFHTPNRDFGGAEEGTWDVFHHVGEPPLATSQLSETDFGGWGSFGPDGADEDQPDFLHVQRALADLRDAPDGPTAVFLGLFKPHLPFVVPQKYFDLYDPETLKLPDYASIFEAGERPDWELEDLPWPARRMIRNARQGLFDTILANDEWVAMLHAYLASVSFSDHLVGEFLAGLSDLDLLDQATIIVTSDHGFQLGEKTTLTKFTLWEQGTRVPLLLRLPDKTAGRIGSPVSLLDLSPTIDAVAQIESPGEVRGVDLMATARTPNADRIVLSSFHFTDANGPVLAISARDSRYRVTRYNEQNFEMYDYVDDPLELTNLAHDGNAPMSSENQAAFDRLAAAIPADPTPPITL